MAEINLLDLYPRAKRPIDEREAGRDRAAALKFGREYFDGDRTQGYGGYRYDGRWVPIAKRFREHYRLGTDARILDVGCAKGFLLHDLGGGTGLDVSRYALDRAMPGLRLVQGTADRLPFPDRAFDLAISINTIHNLPRERCVRALRELERVARWKYVQVDSYLDDEQRRNFERWQLTALTHDTPDGWRKLFAEAGYTGDYYWTITE